jgi:RHS repeat-associated protein
MVTDSTRNITGAQVFDAFGNQVSATGSNSDPQQWQGCALYRTHSQDAGLIQSGCRYYDPQVGRFITADADLDQHPYIYCNGDPVNGADPSGRDPGSLLLSAPHKVPPMTPFPGHYVHHHTGRAPVRQRIPEIHWVRPILVGQRGRRSRPLTRTICRAVRAFRYKPR